MDMDKNNIDESCQPNEVRNELVEVEVEMCEPMRLMHMMASCANAHNTVNGEFAFNEHVRNAIGMQLLQYAKRVIKEY